MTVTRESPAGARYGRPADGRADRRLKILGVVLGAAMLGVIGWFGFSYVAGQDVSGELIKFKVVSDETVEAHLEVRKDPGAAGVCTVRSLSESGAEVGWKDIRFDEPEARVDKVATVRTTERATALELVGCQPADGG
ncbi:MULTISPECIES: DUF4307 domain-containing protein [Streptomyces]|uniref:DUF4307 domain-containing protein n=1 Tax=Streptomyces lycii TaxID=2654337 RepID=A0ABQ7FPK0_9ACTN|nr:MULTISPECIES: DUF4307 domain-containing protein [Streptomyces]KAF4409163.1 DUF4307 domain-containing protein [Streptomyces lycii]PGH48517.1 hypothetical protein CRI70_22790 [Streptomyces sp. Ru87]